MYPYIRTLNGLKRVDFQEYLNTKNRNFIDNKPKYCKYYKFFFIKPTLKYWFPAANSYFKKLFSKKKLFFITKSEVFPNIEVINYLNI